MHRTTLYYSCPKTGTFPSDAAVIRSSDSVTRPHEPAAAAAAAAAAATAAAPWSLASRRASETALRRHEKKEWIVHCFGTYTAMWTLIM